MKRFAYIIKITAVCAAAALLIIFSENTAKSIENSINVCISCIIPSMFALMAVSAYIISEGYYSAIFKPLYYPLHKLIRLDKHTFAVFLLSLVGGYPIGIKLLRERIAQNKNYHAISERAAVFCYCISPPFAINMIGLGVFGSAQAGILVYVSNALSCLIMAISYTRTFSASEEFIPTKNPGGLIKAAESASRSLFTICTVLIAFNALLEAIRSLLAVFFIDIPPLVLSFFEISNLLNIQDASITTLPLAAAISAFGGVCVIAQCFALCGKAFPLKRFLLGRVIAATLSAGICRLLLCFFEISLPASGGMGNSYRFSPNSGVWVLLVLMAVIIFGKNKKIFKKG